MARHVPHLHLPGPWSGDGIALTDAKRRHLESVLRLGSDSPVTYTDGRGSVGKGMLADGGVVRHAEETVDRPATLQIAVAPVRSTDRMRFLVEKLQELGVAKLIWLLAKQNQSGPPRGDKCQAWAAGALEQSRGGWLMEIVGPLSIDDIADPLVADAGGGERWSPGATWCIGPEGGWAAGEIPPDVPRAGLGPTILRTETAALVAAARSISTASLGSD